MLLSPFTIVSITLPDSVCPGNSCEKGYIEVPSEMFTPSQVPIQRKPLSSRHIERMALLDNPSILEDCLILYAAEGRHDRSNIRKKINMLRFFMIGLVLIRTISFDD